MEMALAELEELQRAGPSQEEVDRVAQLEKITVSVQWLFVHAQGHILAFWGVDGQDMIWTFNRVWMGKVWGVMGFGQGGTAGEDNGECPEALYWS